MNQKLFLTAVLCVVVVCVVVVTYVVVYTPGYSKPPEQRQLAPQTATDDANRKFQEWNLKPSSSPAKQWEP